jgi:hypothetical protein
MVYWRRLSIEGEPAPPSAHHPAFTIGLALRNGELVRSKVTLDGRQSSDPQCSQMWRTDDSFHNLWRGISRDGDGGKLKTGPCPCDEARNSTSYVLTVIVRRINI